MHLTRRQILAQASSSALLAAACARGGARRGESAAGPNLLVVMPDEWRGMALSARGNPNLATPVVDGLAAEGVSFAHAFANVPQCSPNRSTLLSGRFPQATGVLTNDMPIQTDQRSLAHVLGARGYNCGYIGKWHLDGWPRDRFTPPGPRRLGFDDYWAASNGVHEYYRGRYYLDDPTPREAQGWEPEHQTELALGFLERAAADERPFFLFLSYGPPHAPYRELPFEDLERASRAELELRSNVLAEDVNPVDLALYYAACEAIDRLVGRLRDGLRELGLEGETLLVFTSDHGSMLGSHGLSGKQTPFEEAISVPLVLSQPGRLPRDARPQALFSALDFAPTLCGLLGADPEPDWSGTDLSAQVLGHPGEAPTSVYLAEMLGLGRCFTQDIHTWRGVRTPRWTYAEDSAGPWLLYDLERDPYQLENLVARPELAGKRAELARELGAWATRLDDPRTSPREQALAAGAGDELSGLHARILEDLQPTEALAQQLRTYLDAGEGVPCRRF